MAEKKLTKTFQETKNPEKSIKKTVFFTAEITPIGIAKNIAKQIEKS